MSELPHDVRHPAKEVHIVPSIKTHSLLSVPKFAEAGYITVFDDEEVNIYDAQNTTLKVSRGAIVRGWFDKKANLWRIPLIPVVLNNNTDTVLVNKQPTEFLPGRTPIIEAINNVYELKTQPELVRYLHACAGFPTKPSWIKAIKNGQYASWPGLTVKAVAKHFPESEETMKGHGRKTKSGLRSTKAYADSEPDFDDVENATMNQTHSLTKQKESILMVFDLSDEAQRLMYTDQTGKFPKKSSKGNHYIMVLIEIDSNAILVEAMKNRTAGEMIRAYLVLVTRLSNVGVKPKMHILDNECSEEFKAQIRKNNMTFQLVPPHDHRRNIAEKAIQTFKAHFISILCGTDKDFPLHLWCRLLPQAEHTLNMLRSARVAPNVSAYAYLWKQHDFNANPFAPLGCKVEAHIQPAVRETWAAHTASGYYIGNAWDHYRCHEIYITDTKHSRICETVFFKHKYLTMPSVTPADALIKAADNLVDTINGIIPKHSVTSDAVTQLMEIYKIAAEKATCEARTQRVLREQAQAQRVKEEQQPVATQQASPLNTPTVFPDLEVDLYPDTDSGREQGTPIISQDEDNYKSHPAANTRQQRQIRTLTQDYMLHMMETPGYTAPFSPRQAASRTFPLQFLCDLAYSVLDDDTGDLLEYRHLIKHPKYKDTWSNSFGKEIRRLATTTETIFFISKTDIPQDRKGDETYGRIVCVYREGKKDKYRTRITIGGNLINFPGDCGTPTADLLTVKLLFNSIISHRIIRPHIDSSFCFCLVIYTG